MPKRLFLPLLLITLTILSSGIFARALPPSGSGAMVDVPWTDAAPTIDGQFDVPLFIIPGWAAGALCVAYLLLCSGP